jgi:ElaA protein
MIAFVCKSFDELSTAELYRAMALRQEVFVVEQQCFYQDADGKDPLAWHLLGTDAEGDLVAYARIFPRGAVYDEYPAIGRIITSMKVRGTGAGRLLVAEAIRHCERLCGKLPIKIGAQAHLDRFYGEFGFRMVGEPYLEDGIPHIYMVRG